MGIRDSLPLTALPYSAAGAVKALPHSLTTELGDRRRMRIAPLSRMGGDAWFDQWFDHWSNLDSTAV